MSETPKCPHDDDLKAARIRREAHKSARSERQRRADSDGRPDRVAELVADINVAVQRSRWSLEVRQAEHVTAVLEDDTDLGLSDGVWLSGDHRPTM